MVTKDLIHRGSPEPVQNTLIYSESVPSTLSKKRRSEFESSSGHNNPPSKKTRHQTIQTIRIESRCPDCLKVREWFEEFPAPDIKSESFTDNFVDTIISNNVDCKVNLNLIPEVLRTMPAQQSVHPLSGRGSVRGSVSRAQSQGESQTLSKASSSRENSSGVSSYRKFVLNPKGIFIFPTPTFEDCVYEYGQHVPSWVRDLVSGILDDVPSSPADDTFMPEKSRLQNSRRSMYRKIYQRDICLIEETLKMHLANAIVPLSTEQFDSKVVLEEVKCQPFSFQAIGESPFLATGIAVTKPMPDMIYGYTDDSFPDIKHRIEELISLFCNKSDIMFPYLAVEYKPMGGNLWHATNQCLVDTAFSLHQTENAVGYGQPMFSVAINDETASLFVTWTSDTPFNKADKHPSVERYYLTMKIKSFLVLESESFEHFWKCLVNIHCWAATARYEELAKKLIDFLDQPPSPSPTPPPTQPLVILSQQGTDGIDDTSESNKRNRSSTVSSPPVRARKSKRGSEAGNSRGSASGNPDTAQGA
ncbi:hypothetical protein ABKA04_001663 [Annulohypoxylon sp. FPYF3050]